MITGVSVESVTEVATFTALAGSWSTVLGVGNLGDMDRPSMVGRATGGSVSFKATWATPAYVSLVALCAHNLAAGDIRVRLYMDTAMTLLVADSGTSAIWPSGGPVADFRPTRPVLFTEAVTAQAARVDLTSLSGTTEIGCVEIANFWNWWGVSPGADIGLAAGDNDGDLAGGARDPADDAGARTYDGQVDLMSMYLTGTKGLDFQKLKSLTRPFVFIDNYEDPPSWARRCFLTKNTDLPPAVGALYRHDAFQFRLKEHHW